jgi:hypothetical protein
VLWKHSFLPLEEAPLDFERYSAVVLDMMLDGLCAKEAA